MRSPEHDLDSDLAPGCCLGDSASRRAFLASLLGVVATACAGPMAGGSARREEALMAQATATLAAGPTIDLHAHPGFYAPGALPLTTIQHMQEVHIAAAFFSVVGDHPVIRREPQGIRNVREPRAGELYQSALQACARLQARVQEGHLRLISDPGDIAAARRAQIPAALLAFEGGDALEGEVARVREFYALGMRSIQLMHYRVNELGDIQTEPPQHHGLTSAGHAIIAEMNRLGMIVDGAHAAPATLQDILAASRTPIIVSHTGPAALRSRARHLSDDLLKAVAAQGGVIGIWPLAPRGGGSLDQMLADIDYVRRLVGIDHVGIGTDMNGMSTFTAMPTYHAFAPLPAALLARGFTETDIRQLLGGNLMRVFEAVTHARG